MTEPRQPADHPSQEQTGDRTGERDPVGHAPNGVPPNVKDAEAKGYPTSDRVHTEGTAHPDQNG